MALLVGCASSRPAGQPLITEQQYDQYGLDWSGEYVGSGDHYQLRGYQQDVGPLPDRDQWARAREVLIAIRYADRQLHFDLRMRDGNGSWDGLSGPLSIDVADVVSGQAGTIFGSRKSHGLYGPSHITYIFTKQGPHLTGQVIVKRPQFEAGEAVTELKKFVFQNLLKRQAIESKLLPVRTSGWFD
ncbi:MAG: hypothetical protein GKR89_01325 [Candidatus Latescibacteria bacterium]|nr:hypothetical protein [Candidatus Latescibacterota bacterium]